MLSRLTYKHVNTNIYEGCCQKNCTFQFSRMQYLSFLRSDHQKMLFLSHIIPPYLWGLGTKTLKIRLEEAKILKKEIWKLFSSTPFMNVLTNKFTCIFTVFFSELIHLERRYETNKCYTGIPTNLHIFTHIYAWLSDLLNTSLHE